MALKNIILILIYYLIIKQNKTVMETILDVRRNLQTRNNVGRRKMTDRQYLAYLSNYSDSHVSKMLNGSRNVTFDFFTKAKNLAERNVARGVMA